MCLHFSLVLKYRIFVAFACLACRSERETLETSLFDAQQQLLQAESRREQLEAENQNLRVRCETATGEGKTS